MFLTDPSLQASPDGRVLSPDLWGVAGLTADSRAVKPGFLFAALPGSRADGRDFIPDAVRAGATVVLAPEGTVLPPGCERARLIVDADPRALYARIAAAFYGLQPERTVAVTGTNGKTSTVQFARQIWTLLGRKAGSIGTLGVIAPGIEGYGSMTTPDAAKLHAELATLAGAGVQRVAMEASSHGLDQRRLDGVRLAAGAFTNLNHEHLDYHGSMEAYFEAKARLFRVLPPPGAAAVVNADVPEFPRLAEIARDRGLRLIGYGRAGEEIALRKATPLPHGQRLELRVMGQDHVVELPLVGDFQAMNALCALGLVIGTGEDPQAATATLAKLAGVPGRLELAARRANGAAVYVDYAHKPIALESVLKTLRPFTSGRLAVVFGCGGDRDRAKRPMMGEIAARLADRVYVADDNPRTEDAASIRAEVMRGCPDATEIGDRREAIRAAVRDLQAGDVLVVAGKGHEAGQIVGKETLPFDDREEARTSVVEADGAAR